MRPDDVAEDDSPSRWQFPNDPLVVEEAFRGFLAWQLGDLDACWSTPSSGATPSRAAPFPHGPFSLCYACTTACGSISRSASSAGLGASWRSCSRSQTGLGFDFWSVSAASLQSTLTAAVELTRADPDPAALVAESERQSSLRSVISLIDSRAFLPFGLTRQAAVADVLGDHQGALGLLDQARVLCRADGRLLLPRRDVADPRHVLRGPRARTVSLHALERALRGSRTNKERSCSHDGAERDLDELGAAVGRR